MWRETSSGSDFLVTSSLVQNKEHKHYQRYTRIAAPTPARQQCNYVHRNPVMEQRKITCDRERVK